MPGQDQAMGRRVIAVARPVVAVARPVVARPLVLLLRKASATLA